MANGALIQTRGNLCSCEKLGRSLLLLSPYFSLPYPFCNIFIKGFQFLFLTVCDVFYCETSTSCHPSHHKMTENTVREAPRGSLVYLSNGINTAFSVSPGFYGYPYEKKTHLLQLYNINNTYRPLYKAQLSNCLLTQFLISQSRGRNWMHLCM